MKGGIMGNYNPVYRSLWSNQRFSGLKPDEKLVFLYLLTNEKTQQTGIYQILLKQIACDCNLDLEPVADAVQSLIDKSLITYWENESLIYIRKFFKFAKGMIKKPATLDATIRRQRELINNPDAWKMFDDEYTEELKSINKALINNQANKDNSKDKNSSSSNNHNIKEE